MEIINFYGGFFSLALYHFGLSKLSCGICYSRSREVQSESGGGGLPIRYYEPHLKTKLPIADMSLLYSDIPELFTCKCDVCSKYSQKFAGAASKEDKDRILIEFFGDRNKKNKTQSGFIDWQRSRLHFLHSQKAEKEQIEKTTNEDTIADIRANYSLLRKTHFDPFKYGSYEHLNIWADCLESCT